MTQVQDVIDKSAMGTDMKWYSWGEDLVDFLVSSTNLRDANTLRDSFREAFRFAEMGEWSAKSYLANLPKAFIDADKYVELIITTECQRFEKIPCNQAKSLELSSLLEEVILRYQPDYRYRIFAGVLVKQSTVVIHAVLRKITNEKRKRAILTEIASLKNESITETIIKYYC